MLRGAAVGVLLFAEVSHAGVVHVVRAGETVESVAAAYYGNRSLALLVLEANHLARGAHLRPGQKLAIPAQSHVRVKRGQTLGEIAKRTLGDARRAEWLAEWNGFSPSQKPRDDAELKVPYQIVHTAGAPESLSSVARMFFSDPSQAKMLQSYNFRGAAPLAKGETILVPILVKVRAVRLPSGAAAKAARAKAHEDDTQKREAELAARVAARLELAEKAYREGSYSEVPPSLTKLLSEEDPSEAQLVDIHRLLAFAYVALGADEVAVREFREVIARDPDATLDATTVSPKIRAAFEHARAGQ